MFQPPYITKISSNNTIYFLRIINKAVNPFENDSSTFSWKIRFGQPILKSNRSVANNELIDGWVKSIKKKFFLLLDYNRSKYELMKISNL